jgi:cell division protein FtsB
MTSVKHPPAGPKKRSRVASTPGRPKRARLVLCGSVVLSAAILAAWFPAVALLHQRSSLSSANAQLRQMHDQDAALAQERKNLNAASEISRLAREQYQLVSPGQQAYEVLPPAGTAGATGLNPIANGPVAPSASAELPPGGPVTTTPQSQGATGASGKGNASSQESAFTRMLHALEFWR